MTKHVFTGFGFGPIQAGLFASEAFQSGNFDRIVIAEIDQKLVEAVRAHHGTYFVNVARADRVDVLRIDNIEIYNPNLDSDRRALLDALAQSTEITTSLPAVKFYSAGGPYSVAALIAHALEHSSSHGILIYAAENHNHAAEILEEAVVEKMSSPPDTPAEFLNTVIGKMSGVLTDPDEIRRLHLTPMTPALDRAFLVEEFNRIMVTRCRLPGFRPGIEVFLEKDDLLPFEEAKLYGHNAIHALLGYLGNLKGCTKMTELQHHGDLMKIGRDAFLHESGAALIKKYACLHDDLFTEPGYRAYADDLLARMTNPFLTDTVARTGRDPLRKLSLNDRIYGTMAVVLEQHLTPANMALGALAGLHYLLQNPDTCDLPNNLRRPSVRHLDPAAIETLLRWLWHDQSSPHTASLIQLTQAALPHLLALLPD